MSQRNSPILISLDGNIGAGKSTLLDVLAKELSFVKVIPEPVGDWLQLKDESGNSLLSLFYSDIPRWCYTFQNCALLTRLIETERIIQQWKESWYDKYPILITERSIMTDRYVFADMLYKQGKMTKLEWDIYMKWFSHYASDIPVKGIIHLTTNAQISKERIGIRGRPGEEDIPMLYLKDLEAQHQKWIQESHLPTLQISTEPGTNMKEVADRISSWLKKEILGMSE
jgi:deoxyadenosine/deoxycytidine kinase